MIANNVLSLYSASVSVALMQVCGLVAAIVADAEHKVHLAVCSDDLQVMQSVISRCTLCMVYSTYLQYFIARYTGLDRLISR